MLVWPRGVFEAFAGVRLLREQDTRDNDHALPYPSGNFRPHALR